MIDTDILVDAGRGLTAAKDFLATQQRTDGISISVISVMELIEGCRNRSALTRVQRFLIFARLLPVTASASLAAYRLMESFFLSHILRLADALIAATALAHHEPLYTKNVRHFRMIPGLSVMRPY